MDILDQNQNKVGHVCSGTHSPTLKKSIGMCYVSPKLAQVIFQKYFNKICSLALNYLGLLEVKT